jgi:hypothetical protein
VARITGMVTTIITAGHTGAITTDFIVIINNK